VLDGRLAAAPIASPAYVLDSGAGTGIWCFEFAERYPASFVIGTDLCLIQPVPNTSNCVFILENSETADWMFPYTLDYIHMRNVGPCFSDIRTVIGKSFHHMTPGGWLDLQDPYWVPRCIDDSLRGTALERWFELVVIGGQRQGRDLLKSKHYKDYLTQAGFTNVKETKFELPGGPWVKGRKLKDIGRYVGAAFLQLVDSYQKFLEFAGLTQPEIMELLTSVKQDLANPKIYWYIEL
jgi:trans-aconitate methyltransferase